GPTVNPGRWWSGWTLRRRLLAAVIALLALICLIVGFVTHAVLRQYLIAQVDDRLHDTAQHAMAEYTGDNHPGGVATGDHQPRSTAFLGPGDPDGTLYATISGGSVMTAAYVDDHTPDRTSDAQNAALLTVEDGDPVTRDLTNLGDYRLVAQST